MHDLYQAKTLLFTALASFLISRKATLDNRQLAPQWRFETKGIWALLPPAVIRVPSGLRKFVIPRNFADQEFVILPVFNEMPLAATLLLLGSERIGSYAAIGWRPWTRPPKRIVVLKIQRTANGVTVIALSGRMETEHIVELETLLKAEPPGRPIVLDLKHLTLAGQSEIDFFAQCEERGVSLANCAAYIREWITNQRNGKQSNEF